MAKPSREQRLKEIALLNEHQKRNQEAEDMERRRQAALRRAAPSGYRRPPFDEQKAAPGPPENKAMTPTDLESKTRDELEQMAADRGLVVERGDGKDGAPLKADYIRVLAG